MGNPSDTQHLKGLLHLPVTQMPDEMTIRLPAKYVIEKFTCKLMMTRYIWYFFFPPNLQGRQLCDFLFALLSTIKGVYSKRKEFAPPGSKFFPFRVDSFSKGRQNHPLKEYQFPFNNSYISKDSFKKESKT